MRGFHLERAIVEVLPDYLSVGVGSDEKLSSFMELSDEAVDSLAAQATSGISGRIKVVLHANRKAHAAMNKTENKDNEFADELREGNKEALQLRKKRKL